MAVGVFNVSDFRSNMKYGGARPTLFRVLVTFPAGVSDAVGAATKTAFTMKSGQIPQSQVGVIDASYFGRPVKFAGDRTFQEWSGTVMNDEDFLVREAFESWQNLANKLSGDTNSLRDDPVNDSVGYTSLVTIEQYNKVGKLIKRYQLVNAWPTEVGPIQLSWDNRDTIEEFEVTFAYDYFVTDKIGNLKSS